MTTNTFTPTWLLVFVALAVATVAFANDLEARRSAYDAQLGLLKEPFQAKVARLNEGYRGAVQKLQEKLQKQGDLDRVLIVKKELERIAASPEAGAGQDSPEPELAALQKTYAEALAKIEAELQNQQGGVLRLHLKALADLQRTSTAEGKIDEAVAIRGEIEKLKKTPLARLASRPQGNARIPLDYMMYYSFDEKEEDGRVLDQSRNGLHGVSSKNAWMEGGKRGGGFDFTTGDFISLAHEDLFHAESFTIAAWVHLKKGIFHGRILDKYNHDRKTGYSFNVHQFKPELELWGSDRQHYRITIEGKLPPREWRHVAVSFAPGKAFLYIDGELAVEKEMPEAIRPNYAPMRIGQEKRLLLGGYLDELIFYPRVLSSDEVTQVMWATGKSD